MTHAVLLSTAYCGPLPYFSLLAGAPQVYIEKHENFIKQTYRNRCVILGANGPLPLVIPVEKGRAGKVKITDLRIADQTPWQRNHWRSIFSAYNSSPFFEYYQEELRPFFEKKQKFLFDFNMELTETLLGLLEIAPIINFTEDFEQLPVAFANFRQSISPKAAAEGSAYPFPETPYTQVFSEKFGFVPQLSILDLLFNEGPNSRSVLTGR